MKFKYLHIPFYFGLSILFMGVCFVLWQWPAGYVVFFTGWLMELVFHVLLVIEILTSVKARRNAKLGWGCFYIIFAALVLLLIFRFRVASVFLLFILGSIYLGRLRRSFIPTRSARNITFDSFNID